MKNKRGEREKREDIFNELRKEKRKEFFDLCTGEEREKEEKNLNQMLNDDGQSLNYGYRCLETSEDVEE